MYVQEWSWRCFYLNWPTFFGESILYFNCFLSVTAYMKSKSWQCCVLDITTYTVKVSQDEQQKHCLLFLKSVRIPCQKALDLHSTVFLHFAWWVLVITSSHHTKRRWEAPISSDVLQSSLYKCTNKNSCGQSVLCPSMLRFLLVLRQHTVLQFAALPRHEQTFP